MRALWRRLLKWRHKMSEMAAWRVAKRQVQRWLEGGTLSGK
jgi:hypothetical protein